MSKEAIRTPKFRVAFPAVFEPKKTQNGQDKYSVMMIFDKEAQGTEEFTALKKAVQAVLKDKWPKAPAETLKERFSKVFKPGEKCVKQDTGERYNGCDDGTIVLRAQSSFKPEVINQKKDTITDESEFYAGCYALAKVTPATFDVEGNKGVTMYLGNMMKLADGERLSGSRSASSDFEDVEAEVEDINLDDIDFD